MSAPARYNSAAFAARGLVLLCQGSAVAFLAAAAAAGAVLAAALATQQHAGRASVAGLDAALLVAAGVAVALTRRPWARGAAAALAAGHLPALAAALRLGGADAVLGGPVAESDAIRLLCATVAAVVALALLGWLDSGGPGRRPGGPAAPGERPVRR